MEKREKIESRHNNLIKGLKALNLKKNREEEKRFIVENFTIIKDALEAGWNFEALFVSEEFMEKYPQKFESLNRLSQAPYYIITPSVNGAYSSLKTPSGITAVYQMDNKALAGDSSVIYLDNIQDPGNIGTILRSAVAFGFKNAVLGGDCADIYNPKTITAAKGANFKLNIIEDADGSWLEHDNRPLYATSSHAGEDLENFKAEKNFCLILGNETRGVSELILEKADKRIRIEMSQEIESLNVAIAASIILYKLRQ